MNRDHWLAPTNALKYFTDTALTTAVGNVFQNGLCEHQVRVSEGEYNIDFSGPSKRDRVARGGSDG